MRVLRAAERAPTPWKNGGGWTREIAVHPPGAGMDDFDWRVSMATVEAGGPFSLFPGVDRLLTLLSGEMTLEIGERAPVRLHGDSAPLAFPGDAATIAVLEGGPVVDLNVMVRRGRFAAEVRRRNVDGPFELAPTDGIRLVLVRGDVAAGLAGEATMLKVDDALLLKGGEAPRLESRAGPVEILVVGLTELGRAYDASTRQPPPRA